MIGTLDDEVVITKTDDYLLSINEAKNEFIIDVKNGTNITGKDIKSDLFGIIIYKGERKKKSLIVIYIKVCLLYYHLDRFKELILDPQHFDSTISKQSLLSEKYNFSEDEQTQLCQYGLLIPHINKDLYRFTIRGQGTFMSYYQKGRIEILRCKYSRA